MGTTVAEYKNLLIVFFISVFSGVTVAENVSASIDFQINANDGITVQESVQTAQESFISVNDTVTIDEQITLPDQLLIDAAETISCDESVSVPAFHNTPITSEDPTIVEVVTITPFHNTIDVNDAVATDESTIANVTSDIYVVATPDTVTVGEYRDVEIYEGQRPCIYVNETVTIEVTTTGDHRSISVNDTVSISESFALEPDKTIDVYDDIAVAEDVATPQFVSAGIKIDVYDHTEVGDPWFDFEASPYDTVTTQEFSNVNVGGEISVYDAVTVGDEGDVDAPAASISDDVAVSESVAVVPDIVINVNETPTVQDVYAAGGDLGNIDTSEVIWYWDQDFPPPTGHWITENVYLVITAVSTLFINVNDDIVTVESTAAVPSLAIIVNEAVSVEGATGTGGFFQVSLRPAVSDSCSVDEDTIRQIYTSAYAINKFDEITTAEFSYVSVGVEPISISVVDAVGVGDGIDIVRAITSRLNVVVRDWVTISECVSRDITFYNVPDPSGTWTDIGDPSTVWTDITGTGKDRCGA